jgi:hypothetical protein
MSWFFFLGRAKKRVARQLLDSKMPLGRIIDIRKKVFADVKVSFISLRLRRVNDCAFFGRKLPTLVLKLEMSGLYHKCDSRQIVKFLLLAVGREQSSFGMYLRAPF